LSLSSPARGSCSASPLVFPSSFFCLAFHPIKQLMSYGISMFLQENQYYNKLSNLNWKLLTCNPS
jgi:hypothetical protein